MQRSAKFIAAAALAIGGVSFIGSSVLAEDATSSQPQEQQQSPPGQSSGASSQDRTSQSGTSTQDRTSQSNQSGQDQSSTLSQGSITKEQVVYGVIAPQKADQSQLPQGFTKTEVNDASSIREAIGQFTQAALQKGQEQQLLQALTQKDQQRLQDAFKPQEGGQIDQHLTQLQQAWQQKYGSFDANQFANGFNQQYTVMQGQITQPQLLSNWPVQQPSQQSSQSGQSSQQPGQSSQQSGQSSEDRTSQSGQGSSSISGSTATSGSSPARTGQSGQTSYGQSGTSGSTGQPSGQSGTSASSGESSSGQSATGGQASGQQSQQEKQAAVVVFPAEQNISETYVSMIREGNSWKIDVPEQLDGQKLRQNLDKHLNEFVQAKDQWPKDVNQAYRIAAHHVMMALYDTGSQSQSTPGQTGQSTQDQSGQIQQGQNTQSGQTGSTPSGSSSPSQQR